MAANPMPYPGQQGSYDLLSQFQTVFAFPTHDLQIG